MVNKKLLMMIEASFFAVFALILDLLPSIKPTPNISISFAMVPIFIIALRWGIKGGVLSGFFWGLLQVVLADAYILTPLQGFIEYFVAFAFIGLAGLFSTKVKNNWTTHKKQALGWMLTAVFVGSLARYFWHFVAGVIFWGEYAPDHMSPVLFSFVVNGATMLGASLLCSVVLYLLVAASPSFLMNKINGKETTAIKKIS